MKKQKDLEKKNVTADATGKVVYIKALTSDKLQSDFISPKPSIKDRGEILGNLILKTDKSEAPQVNSNQILSTATTKDQAGSKQSILKKPTMRKGTRKSIVENNTPNVNTNSTNISYIENRFDGRSVAPAGSNFE